VEEDIQSFIVDGGAIYNDRHPTVECPRSVKVALMGTWEREDADSRDVEPLATFLLVEARAFLYFLRAGHTPWQYCCIASGGIPRPRTEDWWIPSVELM